MKRFSSAWKSSKSRRKQRKYRYNAPLHTRHKFVSSHLSKELMKKYGRRSITLRKGDSVKVMRGKFKGKTGKVERVELKEGQVYITGIETSRKDGTKAFIPVSAHKLLVTEPNLYDKKRQKRMKG